jgi:hypothetical protein
VSPQPLPSCRSIRTSTAGVSKHSNDLDTRRQAVPCANSADHHPLTGARSTNTALLPAEADQMVKSVSQHCRSCIVPRTSPAISPVLRQRSRRPRCITILSRSQDSIRRAGIPNRQPKPAARSPESPPPRCRDDRLPRRRSGAMLSTEAPCCTVWTYQLSARFAPPLTGWFPLAVSRTGGKPSANRPSWFRSHRCLRSAQVVETTQTFLRPCRTPDCPGADQTGVCAIAWVSESSTSGRYSSEESVVSTPVARRRHPYPFMGFVPLRTPLPP